MTSNEKYRELIIRMVNEIHNNVWVKRIFAIVHHMYIRERSEEVLHSDGQRENQQDLR
jgi:hypothetical protein